jgi:hypothetical protein
MLGSSHCFARRLMAIQELKVASIHCESVLRRVISMVREVLQCSGEECLVFNCGKPVVAPAAQNGSHEARCVRMVYVGPGQFTLADRAAVVLRNDECIQVRDGHSVVLQPLASEALRNHARRRFAHLAAFLADVADTLSMRSRSGKGFDWLHRLAHATGVFAERQLWHRAHDVVAQSRDLSFTGLAPSSPRLKARVEVGNWLIRAAPGADLHAVILL